MSLPKNARKIIVNKIEYHWMVRRVKHSKIRSRYSGLFDPALRLTVMGPNNKIKQKDFPEYSGTYINIYGEEEPVSYSITPSDVEDFITENF